MRKFGGVCIQLDLDMQKDNNIAYSSQDLVNVTRRKVNAHIFMILRKLLCARSFWKEHARELIVYFLIRWTLFCTITWFFMVLLNNYFNESYPSIQFGLKWQVIPERMPDCSFFLEGLCVRIFFLAYSFWKQSMIKLIPYRNVYKWGMPI